MSIKTKSFYFILRCSIKCDIFPKRICLNNRNQFISVLEILTKIKEIFIIILLELQYYIFTDSEYTLVSSNSSCNTKK